jgi:hypothetical protein
MTSMPHSASWQDCEYSFRRIRYEPRAGRPRPCRCRTFPPTPATRWCCPSWPTATSARRPRSSIEVGRSRRRPTRPRIGQQRPAERALGNALFYLGRPDEALLMDKMVAAARDGSPARLAQRFYMRSVAGPASVASYGERSWWRAAQRPPVRRLAHRAGTGRAQARLDPRGTEPDESLRLLGHAAATAGAAGNRWIEAFAQTEVWWLQARTGTPVPPGRPRRRDRHLAPGWRLGQPATLTAARSRHPAPTL